MDCKNECRKTKPCKKTRTVWAKAWVTEVCAKRCMCAAKSQNGYLLEHEQKKGYWTRLAFTDHGPIACLRSLIVIEPIVYGGNRRAPHKYHDAQVVELIAKSSYSFAVVCNNVEAVRGQSPHRVYGFWEMLYTAERRKHDATPPKNVEKTTRSAVVALGYLGNT